MGIPHEKPVRSLTAESDAVHVDLLVLKLPVAERHNLLNEYVSGRRDGVGGAGRTDDETDGEGIGVVTSERSIKDFHDIMEHGK